MKRSSKYLAMTIALMLFIGMILSGCTTSPATTQASSAAPTAAPTVAPTAAPTDAPTTAPTEPPAATAKPVTIKFANFSSSGDNAKFLDAMVAAAKIQYPNITVDVETIAYGDYFTQIQTRVAAGTAPDVYELNYENFVAYAKKDILLPLEDLYPAASFDPNTMNKNALGAFVANGKQFGLPFSFSDVVLIYNKDLFDKAGVAYPNDNWTWTEEQAAAEKIRALDKNTFGISHPIQFWEFYKVTKQNGGSILSDDMKKFTLNTPQNVETLQFMVNRVLKSNVMPTAAQFAGTGDWDLFKAGRLGMIVTGIWAFPDFAKNITTFNWDIAMEPGMKTKATHFFANGLVLNKDSKEAQAAFQWAAFMCASKEVANIRVDAGWELPAVTDADVLAKYMKLTPPDNRKAVFDSLSYLVTPPVIEQFTQMSDIVGQQLTAAADGKKTPQQALDDAQKECEAKIKLN
jgi:multiple sugar transport system substrate-binding protein